MGFDRLDSLIMNNWGTGQMSVDGAIIQPSLFERNEMDTLQDSIQQEMELLYGNRITELKNQLDAAEQQTDNYRKLLADANSQLGSIINNLTEDNWFGDCEKEEVLTELCDILGHEAKKEVYFEATVTVRGRVDVPLGEDYDLHDALSDISVDINNGDVVIDDYDLDNAEEL